ncbi:MAG: aspartate/glutamate racemase family protein, partial [Bacteroidales bacterium]|nr:aspartate/glutamate racemase family protein [Candidatus Physcousia equi]
YDIEINKLFPDITVCGIACPMWVQLVESGETDTSGADYFVEKRVNELLETDPLIDAVILGCTHYPLLLDKIERYMPLGVTIISQGEYVARSLQDYLRRHSNIEARLSHGATTRFLTTEEPALFSLNASHFLGESLIEASRITL